MADIDLATILADGEYLKRAGDTLVGDVPVTGGTGEDAVDAVAAALVEGAGIVIAYDDTANTITIASTSSGGTTILQGSVPPDPTIGAVGNYYEDIVAGVLYGPKTSSTWGTQQRPSIAGAPGSDTTATDEGAARYLFARRGRVVGARYQRSATASPLTVKAWKDSTTSKVAEIADANSAAGWFTVTFPTAVPVAAGESFTFSVSTNGNMPRSSTVQVVTGTADVTFVAYCSAGIVDTYPTPGTANTHFVEPIYEPDEAWPTTVRTVAGYAPLAQTVEAVAGTTYTVVAADSGKLKSMTGTATITLPSAGPTAGQRVDFVCVGGPATFTLGGGATWHVAPTPSAVARAVGSFVSAVKMGAATWALTGDLA